MGLVPRRAALPPTQRLHVGDALSQAYKRRRRGCEKTAHGLNSEAEIPAALQGQGFNRVIPAQQAV
ncbi:MAG: hypothetical protein HYX63_05970 [Gammaproteobacteria bacterium]|nr:hypothetical protein [Gammaproteobacteria bacterium]